VGFYRNAGAQFLMQKQTEIGGVALSDFALGWPDLKVASRRLPSDESP